LDSIIVQYDVVYLLILQWGNTSEGQLRRDPLAYDREVYVDEATPIIYKLDREVRRLHGHPELFPDHDGYVAFMKRAGVASRRSQEVLRLTIKARQVVADSRKRLRATSAPPATTDAGGNLLQPWESFAKKMVPREVWPFVGMRRSVPDMELVAAQLLPPAAVLIAASYRVEVSKVVLDIMRVTGQEEALEPFLPRPTSTFDRQIEPGVGAILKCMAAPMQRNLYTNKRVAWGEQENMGIMGSLMALLDGDVRTGLHLPPPAALVAHFLTPEGRAAAGEEPADDEEMLQRCVEGDGME
jgi:hypothetical protein